MLVLAVCLVVILAVYATRLEPDTIPLNPCRDVLRLCHVY